MNPNDILNLRAGELVEVRNREEILATLDETGRLDAMPFMPEMLPYCGQRFSVFKQAHKTCDNIKLWSMRRLEHAVHLTGVRCDGQAHGNCDAGCLIFWHEAWLKRVDADLLKASQIVNGPVLAGKPAAGPPRETALCALESLEKATRKGTDPVSGEDIFACQATDLREFTSDLPWWNVWQYVRDIRSGNLRRGIAGNSKSELFLETLLGCLEVVRALLIEAFNKFQALRKGVQYPHIAGSLSAAPANELNLQPGEFVQVKSKDEILTMLDSRNRNKGLLFDSEMLKYCGGTFRVLKRVHQIVDEKTGKTLKMKSPCIILEGSACASDYHRFCPRAIYHYWREGWLRRVE
jgi:hypothetical protein